MLQTLAGPSRSYLQALMRQVSKGHPRPKIKGGEIENRDLKWIDVGSGVVSRICPRATRLMTTSKGGPRMSDIQARRVWSLSTGKFIDECEAQMTSDATLHRPLIQDENIRVELVLRSALALYERKGP